MTTTEPNAGEHKRGRHAKSEDADRHADPADDGREPAHAAADDPDDEATVVEPTDDGPADDEHAEAADSDRENSDAKGSDENHDGGRDEAADTDDVPADEKEPAEQPVAATSSPAEQSRRPETREEAPAEPKKKRSSHAIAHHPAGSSLLTAAGLITGLALVPLLFDQLSFEVATRAADAARSAAAPWPAGGEPWFWPGSVATLATVVATVVLVVAVLGVRLPDVAVLVTAVVLAVTTARAAWATIDVLDAHLWELVPVCIVCLIAFASAIAAAFRWRSGESAAADAGTGEVAGVTIGAWLLVVLLILGGSAIASSAQTHAFGNVTSPPQDLAGLLSVRAADAPQLDDLRGRWVAQVGAAQVTDDAAASAYAVAHHDWTTKFPLLLARGDDVGAPDVDATWWLSLTARPFGSSDEATAWCSANGLTGCTPRLITG